jgi:O-antigen ligase
LAKFRWKKYKINSPYLYLLSFVIGIIFGTDKLPHLFEGLVFVSIGGVIVYSALRNDSEKIFQLLPYIIYSELIVKGNCREYIPYLFSPYLLIGVFVLLISRSGGKVKIHSRAFVLLLLFCIIEIADSSRAMNADSARFLVVYSLSLATLVLWSSFTIIKPVIINEFLNNVKFASVFLCGVIMVAHFEGKIDYSLQSSFSSTNGLEPVQISGYLGFSSAIFFLAVMRDEESRNRLLNIVLLSVNTIMMLLSFSRGGLYFLSIFILMYLLFNFKRAKNYALLLLLIPVAIGIYYYVTVSTNGVIEQRYGQEGTSGRSELAHAGLILLETNPIAGVGTGNFGVEIAKQNLFAVSSGAHNEFVRVAAEHGILGLITYCGFFILLLFEILNRKSIQREYALYFLVFFILITIHNGMKISLQPILVALAVGTPSLQRVKKKFNVFAEKKLAVEP